MIRKIPRHLKPYFVLLSVAIAALPLGVVALLFKSEYLAIFGVSLMIFGLTALIFLLGSGGWNAERKRTNNPFFWWLFYERFYPTEGMEQ